MRRSRPCGQREADELDLSPGGGSSRGARAPATEQEDEDDEEEAAEGAHERDSEDEGVLLASCESGRAGGRGGCWGAARRGCCAWGA